MALQLAVLDHVECPLGASKQRRRNYSELRDLASIMHVGWRVERGLCSVVFAAEEALVKHKPCEMWRAS